MQQRADRDWKWVPRDTCQHDQMSVPANCWWLWQRQEVQISAIFWVWMASQSRWVTWTFVGGIRIALCFSQTLSKLQSGCRWGFWGLAWFRCRVTEMCQFSSEEWQLHQLWHVVHEEEGQRHIRCWELPLGSLQFLQGLRNLSYRYSCKSTRVSIP